MGDVYSLTNLDPRCTNNLIPTSLIGILGCLFWVAAYILMVRKAFLDHAPALPMVAICCNFAWEFLAAFIFPNPNDTLNLLAKTWFFIDIVIMWQLLRYGRALQTVPLVRRLYLPLVALALILALVGQYTYVAMYQDRIAMVVAFVINLIMSILFVQMLMARQAQGHRRGISVGGAWLKMLGTLCTSIQSHFLVQWFNPELPNVWFLTFLSVSIFFFDCVYLALIYIPPHRLRALVAPASLESS
jgi:hypothetical protein